jgi:hypothetical protein
MRMKKVWCDDDCVKVNPRDLVSVGRRIDIGRFGRVLKMEIACVFFLELELPLRQYHVDPKK